MKNFLTYLVAAVALLAFVGCENGGDNTDTPQENRLASPVVNYNLQGNTIILTWEAVDFAIYYNVTLNGGEATKVEETVYRITELEYDADYTISVVAVSADQTLYLDSKPAVVNVNIPAREVPQYREWYAANNVPASAISNNGRWVVGGNDKQAIVIDLNNDEIKTIADAELYDVADNGVAVGSVFSVVMDGVAAIYRDGECVEVDLGDFACSCSALTGITPDGEFAVGWLWGLSDPYFVNLFGNIVPFTYDIVKNRVSIPESNDVLYYPYLAGIAAKCVAPDRTILGYEQSMGYFSILWNSDMDPWEYVYFNYDESDYSPIDAIGDSNNLMSQKGRYVFGKGSTYEGDANIECAAAYDREKGEMLWFTGMLVGSVTAMTDDGIAFLNDVPYYLGTTSFVTDTNKDLETFTPIVEWLQTEHNMDLSAYILDGIIIVGASEDGRTLVGMTNTEMGWMSFVIDLDGKPMDE